MKGLNPDVVSQWFFGFFYLCFHSSQVWGNLVSSFVLSSTATAHADSSDGTGQNGRSPNLTHCGPHFCPAKSQVPPSSSLTGGNGSVTLTVEKDEYQMEILTGIFLVCSVVAALVIIIGVDSLKRSVLNEVQSQFGFKIICDPFLTLSFGFHFQVWRERRETPWV